MMDLKVYGIQSCDKIRKLFDLFEKYEIEYEFVNFRKEPPTEEKIHFWSDFLGELPVNRRGATYKKIKKQYDKADEAGQIKLLIENFPAIQRPIIEYEGEVVCIGSRPERIIKELFL